MRRASVRGMSSVLCVTQTKARFYSLIHLAVLLSTALQDLVFSITSDFFLFFWLFRETTKQETLLNSHKWVCLSPSLLFLYFFGGLFPPLCVSAFFFGLCTSCLADMMVCSTSFFIRCFFDNTDSFLRLLQKEPVGTRVFCFLGGWLSLCASAHCKKKNLISSK